MAKKNRSITAEGRRPHLLQSHQDGEVAQDRSLRLQGRDGSQRRRQGRPQIIDNPTDTHTAGRSQKRSGPLTYTPLKSRRAVCCNQAGKA